MTARNTRRTAILVGLSTFVAFAVAIPILRADQSMNFTASCPGNGGYWFCQTADPNPCGIINNGCQDIIRQGFQFVPPCDSTPGASAGWLEFVLQGNNWSHCAPGGLYPYECHVGMALCGTAKLYLARDCNRESFCGNANVYACIGTVNQSCQ